MRAEGTKSILRDGAGTQWLPAALDAVPSELEPGGPVTVPAVPRVGRPDRTGSLAMDELAA